MSSSAGGLAGFLTLCPTSAQFYLTQLCQTSPCPATAKMQLHATVSLNSLPSGSLVTFEQSSFFSRNGPDTALPSPSEVLAKSATEDPYFKEHINHPPVLFEPLGLVVKFGKDPTVTIAEGQCLWSLHQLLP